MIKKIKQSTSEKILLIFIILLGLVTFGTYFKIKNKCLFIKKYNPEKLTFNKPENIAILNAQCGNVIIELYPEISPNSVKRFKTLIKSGSYNNVAFHRVIKNVLVQSGDLEFGKKNNLNYAKIGTGKSGLGTIDSETNNKLNFVKGTVAFARTHEKNTEDSQFFIILTDAPLYEGEYTPLGKVLYGLEVIEKIKYDEKSEYILRPDFINYFKMLIN
tara:strand:- start:214 stop:861 length:648 start_codon:yes stop_codon:yes gene_type:complete